MWLTGRFELNHYKLIFHWCILNSWLGRDTFELVFAPWEYLLLALNWAVSLWTTTTTNAKNKQCKWFWDLELKALETYRALGVPLDWPPESQCAFNANGRILSKTGWQSSVGAKGPIQPCRSQRGVGFLATLCWGFIICLKTMLLPIVVGYAFYNLMWKSKYNFSNILIWKQLLSDIFLNHPTNWKKKNQTVALIIPNIVFHTIFQESCVLVSQVWPTGVFYLIE